MPPNIVNAIYFKKNTLYIPSECLKNCEKNLSIPTLLVLERETLLFNSIPSKKMSFLQLNSVLDEYLESLKKHEIVKIYNKTKNKNQWKVIRLFK